MSPGERLLDNGTGKTKRPTLNTQLVVSLLHFLCDKEALYSNSKV